MCETKVKMRAGAAAALLALLLGGCAAKSDREIYHRLHEHRGEFMMLQQSQKVFFRHGDGETTILIATYLPGDSDEGESFIVSSYPGDAVLPSRFRLADTAPIKVRRLSREELPAALRRRTPQWFASYRILFPRSSVKKLSLRLEERSGLTRTLLFAKGPKYLVRKPEF